MAKLHVKACSQSERFTPNCHQDLQATLYISALSCSSFENFPSAITKRSRGTPGKIYSSESRKTPGHADRTSRRLAEPVTYSPETRPHYELRVLLLPSRECAAEATKTMIYILASTCAMHFIALFTYSDHGTKQKGKDCE